MSTPPPLQNRGLAHECYYLLVTNFFARLEPFDLSLQGKLWEVSYSFAQTGNETDYFQLKTNAKSPAILNLEVSSSAEPLKLTVLEAPTMTNGTTAVASYCMNRVKDTTATTQFYSDPTFTSGGTPINIHIVTAGKGGGAISAESGAWKLKTATNYLLKIEQLTNQATTVSINIVFSEDYGAF